jgi:hypothetical protein
MAAVGWWGCDVPPDLRVMLLCVAVAVTCGLLIGHRLRATRPDLCVRYAAWSAAVPWWVFAVAVMSAVIGMPSSATGYGLFAALEFGWGGVYVARR